MWAKFIAFLRNHNAQSHSFAAIVASIGVLYATDVNFQHYVDKLLVSYPQVVSLLGLVAVVYRNYATSHSKEALTRINDPKPKEEAQ